jgi:alkylated DNA repair protein alkB family protein 8
MNNTSFTSEKEGKYTEDVNLLENHNNKTPSIEIEHVREVYNFIAKQWHSTRYKAWPIVGEFCKNYCNNGQIVADIGCGNGKMAPYICNNNAFSIACDTSQELIKICQKQHSKKKYETIVADGVKLPYRSNSFDVALNIAVLHHLSTKERRIQCIKETLRILKPNGIALFYVWAKKQDNSRSNHVFKSSDVFVPFHFRQHGPDYDENHNLYPNHAIKDDNKRAIVLKRYCHVFENEELENIIKPFAKINESYYDAGNYGVSCTKIC